MFLAHVIITSYIWHLLHPKIVEMLVIYLFKISVNQFIRKFKICHIAICHLVAYSNGDHLVDICV